MDKISLETIRLAQGGDESAFQEIYHKYHNYVYYYAYKLIQNEADAKDITQETFLQVYQSLPNLKNPEYLSLWIKRITYSKFYHFSIKQKEKAIEKEDLRYHLDRSDKAKNMNDAMKLDDKAVIRSMIDTLSEKQREVIQLVYYEQLTVVEIAKMLSLPEGTVKSRVFEAKKALKHKMRAFEKTEGRKITLHMDLIAPITGFALLSRLKSCFTQGISSQGVLVASTVSMVVVSSVGVNHTVHILQEQASETPVIEELPKHSFDSVYYEEEQIHNAKDAYFTLLNWASDAEHVSQKTPDEKQSVASIVNELLETDSKYVTALQNSGWMNAYQGI